MGTHSIAETAAARFEDDTLVAILRRWLRRQIPILAGRAFGPAASGLPRLPGRQDAARILAAHGMAANLAQSGTIRLEAVDEKERRRGHVLRGVKVEWKFIR